MVCKVRIKSLSINITSTCKGIGVLNCASSRSTVSFSDQFKYNSTEASYISSKVGH